MATHLAAVFVAEGKPFELQTRPTPKPGPDELLVAVKTIALNPADTQMRGKGLFISKYPTVIGFELSGLVLEVGDNVPTGASGNDETQSFQPGTRVVAFSGSFWKSWGPDYGTFQERCLVPWQHAVRLPDEGISWHQAATLPVAIEVPLNAWDIMGIPRVGEFSPRGLVPAGSTGTSTDGNGTKKIRKMEKKEALLIWGASSSVGTMGVQTARLLREDPDSSFAAVYATAGSANKSYVESLGADRVFDYKDSRVVDAVVSAAKEDGLVIKHCFLANGELALCQAVLKAFIGKGEEESMETTVAKIGSAPVIPLDAEVISGIETMFVLPSMVGEERLKQFQYWIGKCLGENLATGAIKPSPEPTLVGKGLEAINAGLDRLIQGVSCTKLIVEVAE
ncbi:hypothetical protein N7454_005903 [Penicillium verhagenii]|nr:hypothetical protein N7454_005903 [Penicillium verhagenii]